MTGGLVARQRPIDRQASIAVCAIAAVYGGFFLHPLQTSDEAGGGGAWTRKCDKEYYCNTTPPCSQHCTVELYWG